VVTKKISDRKIEVHWFDKVEKKADRYLQMAEGGPVAATSVIDIVSVISTEVPLFPIWSENDCLKHWQLICPKNHFRHLSGLQPFF